jgi:hypothetical protein
VVKAILSYLNSLPGCRAVKRHGGRTRRGEPDITGCLNGRRIEVEVKAPGAAGPTKLQQHCLDQWHRAGAIVCVARSVEDMKAALGGLL